MQHDKDTVKEIIRSHYDKCAAKRDFWIRKHRYYHQLLTSTYQYYIEPGCSVLEVGCGTGELLAALKPSYGLGIDLSEKMIAIAEKKFPQLDFFKGTIEEVKEERSFDYIVISSTLNEMTDVVNFFHQLKRFCSADTRILFDSYNHLWSPLLRFAEKVGLKTPEQNMNWLHMPQLSNLLSMTDYEQVVAFPCILFPWYIPFFSWFFNTLIARLPLVRYLCLNYFYVARLKKPHIKDCSVTICLTVKDEKENIEPLIQNIPVLGRNCEIIFVEGGSTDGTYEEIERCIRAYPGKKIRALKQKGKGQCDAIHLGFSQANGDVIFLLEGDMTTPPQELASLYLAYTSNKVEFISGNRLIYNPFSSGSMPFLRFIGNKIFGILVSFLVRQKIEDTLSGLKGISKKNYQRLRKFKGSWGLDLFGDYEFIFGAAHLGLKIGEVPIFLRDRESCQSKTKVFQHGWMLLKMCVKEFFAFPKKGYPVKNNQSYNADFAKYYDLFYTHKKNYDEEASSIEKLLKEYGLTKTNDVLDIGCGTGEHVLYLASRGYNVVGTDISSHMIKIAKTKSAKRHVKASFQCCSLRDVDAKFSYVYSMFNVVNCLFDLDELYQFFDDVKCKLHEGGIYVFDCWNSGAILHDGPKIKNEKIVSEGACIHRRVVPNFDRKQMICRLDYNYTVFDQAGQELLVAENQHRIKVFREEELLDACKHADLSVVNSFASLRDRSPLERTSWSATYVVCKQK